MADATPEVSSNGSTQSRVVLAKPRLGGFGSSSFGATKSSNPLSSVLRPSQLKLGNNPFFKLTEEDNKDTEGEEVTQDKEDVPSIESTKEDDTPKFMPLGTSNVTARSTVPTTQPSSSSGFVFGQNLSDRVVVKDNVNNGVAEPSDHSSTNGSSESDLLFTSAAATVKESSQSEAAGTSASGAGLAEAAAEYERSHTRPPPPPATEHCTITGEEDESNVLQISCRLFAWEAGSWRERGRGVLRLNDACDGSRSRLVARVAGSLRVVLNTKLWPEMVVERAGTKSLRVTAADAQGQIKLFLIMGVPGDINQLHRALTSRIAVSKKPTTCTQNSTSHEAAVRLDNDYQEKPDDLPEESSDTEQKETDRLQDNDAQTTTDEKSLKRKEPIEDETSPKRQCPKIVIE